MRNFLRDFVLLFYDALQAKMWIIVIDSFFHCNVLPTTEETATKLDYYTWLKSASRGASQTTGGRGTVSTFLQVFFVFHDSAAWKKVPGGLYKRTVEHQIISLAKEFYVTKCQDPVV